MVAKLLDALTVRFGACRIAAYADLSSNMVLVTNSGVTAPRETLNALCREAAATLAAAALPDPSECDVAVTIAGRYTGVFLRLPEEPSDALCCLCDDLIDLASFVPEARACLRALAGPAGDAA